MTVSRLRRSRGDSGWSDDRSARISVGVIVGPAAARVRRGWIALVRSIEHRDDKLVASLLSGRYVAIVATGYCAGRLECDLEAIVGS
jgi:hypothetical protein